MSVDLIGALSDPAPEEGAPRVPLPGFHVNVTPQLIESRPSLDRFVVRPANFRRVWAGDDPRSPTETVALRFADEPTAREALGDLWRVRTPGIGTPEVEA